MNVCIGEIKRNIGLPKVAIVLAAALWVVFSITLAAGIITLEPSGVVTPGSTLTLRIQLTGGNRAVEIEIVRLEPGGTDEKILMSRAPVVDGNTKAPFVDISPEKEIIEIILRLTSEFTTGTYIVRAFPGKGRLPDSAMIEINNRPDLFPFRIDGTLNISRYFKGGTDHSPVYGDLFLMDGKTYDTIGRLTETGDCMQPTWSPDGKQIAYVRWLNDAGQLWVLDVEKDKTAALPRRLMKDFPGSVMNPLWSPDGKHIAFLSGESIWVMKVEGEAPKQVMEFPGIRQLLTWTRDGGQVIFAAKPGENAAILTGQGELFSQGDAGLKPEEKAALDFWQVDVHEGKPRRLLYDASWLWLPYLAPDGSRLMFSLPVQSGGSMLWTREGKNFTRAEMRREGFDPVWSSEGDRIVFVSVVKSK
ncbi:MAG: hypothetical protein NT166_18430 [Candidatus Aminicenantes bacterium]|nr:hypothetical protein [Candidatus Aminicenantes bacterium]